MNSLSKGSQKYNFVKFWKLKNYINNLFSFTIFGVLYSYISDYNCKLK